MQSLLRYLLYPLLSWYAIVFGAVGVMYALAHRASLGPEGKAYFVWVLMIGLVGVLLSWPVCRTLHRMPGTIAGMGLGLVTPIVMGWVWGYIVDPRLYGWNHSWGLPWGMNWGGADAWFAGLQMSIPSAVAGVVVGFFQSDRGRGISGKNEGLET